ncbi:GTPase SAR1 family protein [Runella defluvii]|uniref:GTPase SAR1 family protein n=1 Tax=Runella defluvii TaxID=370973 RepID=A0A7W5ZN21_9BACT|nr:COR domain-containing protein [Runella defluvii]MBB3838677.1 GTPase SAR1 family protein [Runella defluvii]
MARLNELTPKLTLQQDDGLITAVLLVKGYDNSYALNAAGHITAFSLGNSRLKKLVLGKEAEALEYLYFSGSEPLTEVVFEVPLPQLTHLYLNNCAIKQITFPAGFRSLQQIYLQKNGLQRLVFEGDCPSLVLMDVSENELTQFSLPQGFANLTYLYLSGNQLVSLEVANLAKLSTLYLQNNQFSNLPFHFQNTQSGEIQLCLSNAPLVVLEFLRLSANPLPDDIRGFVENNDNCLNEIKAYFKDLSKGETLDNEYKTLIIGNGNVGKSCLVERLVYKRFKTEWDSTHGISLEQFSDQSYIFNLWDFGGQDIYHATHRLFMQSNALYLVLWDSKTEQSAFTEHQIGKECRQYENYPLGYWLDYTHNQGKNSPVIVVQTKTKRDGEKDLAEIRAAYKDIFTFLKFEHIDSQEDDWDENGFNSLLAAMRLAAKRFNRKQKTPKNRAEVRQSLRFKQKAGEKYLSLDDYLILAKEVTNPISVLENWLVKTGVVFYRAGLFQDSIILDQAWAIEAIYTIFRRTNEKGRRNSTYYDIQSRNGRFTGEDLQGIWEEKYSPEEQNLFVSFMLSCEMCFEITSQEHPDLKEWEIHFEQRSFVAPQLMPENKPKSVEDVWEGRSSWYLTYRHDFLHYGVIQSFIVRTQTLAEMRDIWKSGISLKDTHDGAVHYALVECQGNEIRVRVTAGGRVLLNKIRNLFEKLRDSKGIETVSLDGENYVLLDELKNRSKDNPKLKTVNGTWIEVDGLEVFLERDENASFDKPKESEQRSSEKEHPSTKKMIDNSTPHEVTMAEGARKFVPFSEIEGKIKILFLAANPDDTSRLRTDKEGKKSQFELKLSENKDRFEFISVLAATSKDFQREIGHHKPHVIHYSGHGDKHSLYLEDTDVTTELLTSLMVRSKNAQLVILNACNSFAHGEAIAQKIPYVICNSSKVDDKAAIEFAEGFYMDFFDLSEIEDCFDNGLLSIKLANLPHADVPVLLKGTPAKS